ncbi:hypothetical protein [Ornithinibacillus halophilus]|uniref:ABC-2 family transporter protein n=1 Tax=Ornithinibacillus halophilus TaxID=930117 RepID=A0A1M5NBT5_9BACI|nr:hypothetical protein [Ornithinibacillus halophilus]SHG86912.1 hypothetical protein SAMN05216225_10756 [Ornithinibacillus halophilus]
MDKAFRGLLFKEWKMMNGFLLLMSGLAVLMLVVTSYHVLSFLSGLESVFFLAIIIIPATVIYSLNSEVIQLQTFLHNPHSANKLLLSKFVFSITIFFLYILITILLFTVFEIVWDLYSLSTFEMIYYYLFVSFVILFVSIFFAIFGLFLWTLHQVWKVYIGKLSMVLIFLILLSTLHLSSYFTDTSFYQFITEWGYVTPFENWVHPDMDIRLVASFQIGTFVFHGIVAVIMYFLSVYMLDRKMEA